MAERSLLRYLRVADEAPIPVWIDPRPVGTVYVAVDEDARRATREMLDRLAPVQPRVDELDASRLVELEPEIVRDVAGAWLIDAGHRLDPASLTVALALLAASRGATIRHHLRVRALRSAGDRVTGVVTDEGVIETDEVVVAAGPWSSGLLDPIGITLPVIGVRGWI